MHIVKRTNVRSCAFYAASAFCLLGSSSLWAQTAPNPDEKKTETEDAIVLSPFVVEASEDSGYSATSTLAGTRVRTELKDVASSLSVVTKQFLDNTGVKNAQELLVYTTNTEVGGVSGNFSGAGGSTSYGEAASLLRPNSNTRVRGLDAADNTRDYFKTDIPWDGYNVDRVDLSRGANSILFGVGSPAGIINTSVNGAMFKNANKFETRISQYGSVRNVLDINRVLLKNELAIRVVGLDDNTKFQQKPAYNHDQRVFAAVRYAPKLFANGNTLIKANYEQGRVQANRPRTLPPVDGITPWFQTGNDPFGNVYANKVTPDGNTDWTKYTFNAAGTQKVAPWYSYGAMGRSGNPNIGMYYNYNGGTPMRVQSSSPGVGLGINSAGGIDGTIGGQQFAINYGLPGFNAYARNSGMPGGGFYGNKSLADSSIFNFYENLMDGDNKREYQKWKASNVSLSQTFLNDRVGVEFVHDWQSYQDGQIGFLNAGEYMLSVDINAKLLDGTVNPNLGRPYVGNSGQYGNSENHIDRTDDRFTAYGDFRTEDVWGKSLLTKILGHHVFTGVLSQDVKKTDYRGFVHWASEPAYAEYNQRPGAIADITTGIRQVDWIAYLGPTLKDASTAAGANVSRIMTTIAPQEYEKLRFFDSHWNAPSGVLPTDPYTYISYTNTNPANGPIGGPVTNTDVQAENPANYVGWTTKTVKTLSSDRGDIASLYTSGQKSKIKVKSEGLTWQGYMFDGAFVPVFGWRKDTVTNASSQAPKDANQVSQMNFTLDESAANTLKTVGESKSYGFVLHTPQKFQNSLPFGTHFSLFANKSENFTPDAPRGDIFGNIIPNQTGNTKDYGVVISTMNDKLVLKITKYTSKVKDATLSGDNAGFGGSLYLAWALPYWEATHALAALDGIANPQLRQGSWGWPWNGIAQLPNGDPDPVRIKAIVTDFFTKFPLDQNFADQYGLGLNVAKMHSANMADWYSAVPLYGSGSIAEGGSGASALGLQPAYAGALKATGSGPVASGDTTSTGYEYELTAQPTKEWSITLNASSTNASRTSISPAIASWISTYTTFMAGDAGLVKLWGGDTFRKNWQDSILGPYGVLTAQLGLSAPEIAKWRFNVVTNYNFSSGPLKGVNTGLAYRWEDKRVLGYKLNAAATSLDVTQPWYGPDDKHLDLWVGYGRKLTNRIDWRIQLNLRNVGENNHLVPVNINPDGVVALSRIADGMGWQITNTFSF